jgi:ABC-type sulfate/molybdate transport systems ATPase subunit
MLGGTAMVLQTIGGRARYDRLPRWLPQVDRHGNVNSTLIPDGPFLVRSGGGNDVASVAAEVVVVATLTRRALTECGYVTSPGRAVRALVTDLGRLEALAGRELELARCRPVRRRSWTGRAGPGAIGRLRSPRTSKSCAPTADGRGAPLLGSPRLVPPRLIRRRGYESGPGRSTLSPLMARVVLEHVTKRFGDVVAVDDLSLEVFDREFLVLLGPSGCGKSTALRMIAGLEVASEGTIQIGDRVVDDVEPKDRNVAMVFQSYALYPHMTVRKNIEFPLKTRKVAPEEREQLVHDAADTLGLEQLLDRRPAQLSGGQRQRVALARAIVRRPDAFLMDEPLSNLDAKLRVQTRAELIELQRRLEATVLYVTHDQVEAMTMGHRIAIMSEGLLQQIGPPAVYEQAGQPVRRPLHRQPGDEHRHRSVVLDGEGLANAIGGSRVSSAAAPRRSPTGRSRVSSSACDPSTSVSRRTVSCPRPSRSSSRWVTSGT